MAARPSNGTEGDMMRHQLCDWCDHDHSTHHPNEDYVNGCDIYRNSLVSDEPVVQWDRSEDGWSCSEFRGCTCKFRGSLSVVAVTGVGMRIQPRKEPKKPAEPEPTLF